VRALLSADAALDSPAGALDRHVNGAGCRLRRAAVRTCTNRYG
jgi:hypothetical protein